MNYKPVKVSKLLAIRIKNLGHLILMTILQHHTTHLFCAIKWNNAVDF